jgi:hypothetical protein
LNADRLIEIFDRSFPREFQAETLRLLNVVYKESKIIAVEQSAYRSKVLRPQIRVETFNKRWAALAKKFGLQADSYPNSTNTYPVELIEGRDMVLTAKLVNKPHKVDSDALYRKKLSLNNPSEDQLGLFDLFDEKHGSDGANVISIDNFRHAKESLFEKQKYYGMLVHGYSQSDEVNFAQVLIPDSSCNCWLAVVDLFARYSSVLAAPQVEVIEINEPIIKRKKEEKGKDS